MSDTIKDMQDLPALLTPKHIQALGFSKKTTYQWINSERFPKFRVGRKIVIPKADFIEWLSKNLGNEVK